LKEKEGTWADEATIGRKDLMRVLKPSGKSRSRDKRWKETYLQGGGGFIGELEEVREGLGLKQKQ